MEVKYSHILNIVIEFSNIIIDKWYNYEIIVITCKTGMIADGPSELLQFPKLSKIDVYGKLKFDVKMDCMIFIMVI